jgi:Flp pilus assembly protein CpaB
MNVKRGILSTVVIVLLAVAAASGVFLFMNSVRDRADEGRVTVDVLVATQDIPAGQELDPLIENGAFRTKPVDGADLLPGVITWINSRPATAYLILADEQIAAPGPRVHLWGGVLGTDGQAA